MVRLRQELSKKDFLLLRRLENAYSEVSSHNFSKDDIKVCYDTKNDQTIMLDLFHRSVSRANHYLKLVYFKNCDQRYFGALFGLDAAL